jgi:hypothetical protein
MLGKTIGRSKLATPNQEAIVAANSSADVVGIQRPPPIESSGPLITRTMRKAFTVVFYGVKFFAENSAILVPGFFSIKM